MTKSYTHLFVALLLVFAIPSVAIAGRICRNSRESNPPASGANGAQEDEEGYRGGDSRDVGDTAISRDLQRATVARGQQIRSLQFNLLTAQLTSLLADLASPDLPSTSGDGGSAPATVGSPGTSDSVEKALKELTKEIREDREENRKEFNEIRERQELHDEILFEIVKKLEEKNILEKKKNILEKRGFFGKLYEGEFRYSTTTEKTAAGGKIEFTRFFLKPSDGEAELEMFIENKDLRDLFKKLSAGTKLKIKAKLSDGEILNSGEIDAGAKGRFLGRVAPVK